MVDLQDILSHNAQISSVLPADLVAVFVGATSGIGAATLRAFAKYTRRPRVYFVGRSEVAANTIIEECTTLNPHGAYIFIQAYVSLLRVVDEVCSDIRAREKGLNVLFLSPGNIHLLTALCHYSRLRFITQLLPLLQSASSLRRIISVGAAGFEGPLDTSDLPAMRVPPGQIRGHISSLITLGIEAVAREAPSVSFSHSYPGTVNTPLTRRLLATSDVPTDVTIPIDWMAADESGERHMFLLTSARYPSKEDGRGNTQAILGSNGRLGSGVYAVGLDAEPSDLEAIKFLDTLRNDNLIDLVWEHTKSVFLSIIGNKTNVIK
ncbi:hypothetical protein BJX70DRAFT_391232 [Aspergillus crustosus]